MVQKADLIEWIEKSRQRRAIIQVLRKPLTSSEISRATEQHGVRLQHSDIKGIMRVLVHLKLVQILSKDFTTGKLYMLTDLGRDIANERYKINCQPAPASMDWRMYSRIVRSKMKRMVLLGLGDAINRGNGEVPGKSASMVKKQLVGRYPLTLNNSRDCLQFLYHNKLVEVCGETPKRQMKLYRPTRLGWMIYDQIRA